MPLVDELLEALALVCFCNVDVALGIGRDIVGTIKLAGPVSATAEFAYHIQSFAAYDAYDLIRTIGDNDETLGTIGGKRDVPYGSTSKRLLRNERFFDECSILLENLNAIVRPIAHINEPIIRDSRGMHDAELRWRRTSRIILAWAVLVLDRPIEGTRKALSCILEIPIIGLPSIRAPMTFVSPGLRIEHDDSMIHVSIGDVEFACRFINDQRRRTAQILGIIASAVSSAVADLHEEFSVTRELKNLIILLPCPRNPYVALRINIDAVLQLRPFISLARTAP